MATYQHVKHRTYEILEGTRARDTASRVFQWFIITLITLNVLAVVLATVDRLYEPYQTYFRIFEIVSVIVFTVEYVLRVWAITEDERYRRPVRGRLRFMVSPAGLIDLLAILPFFLPRLTSVDLRAIRALRLFRLFRLLKLGRYSESILLFGDVLREKREQIVLAFLAVAVLTVFASSLMYFAEHQAQPEKFASIPDAMWWAVITLTTVGYGDVTPITTFGKVLGGFISLMGIGLFALPAGILASGFDEAMERKNQLRQERAEHDGDEADETVCPCCGRPLETADADAS